MDSHPDTDAGRWLTYGQIAALRRISKASAERLVRRHRWRRQADNQGFVRVLVPLSWAEQPQAARPDDPADIRADMPPDIRLDTAALLHTAIEALRDELTASHQREAEANAKAEALSGKLTDAQAALSAAQADTEQVEARTAELAAQLDQARAAAQEAAQAASELRQADDDARQARGRWARLRAAWRRQRQGGESTPTLIRNERVKSRVAVMNSFSIVMLGSGFAIPLLTWAANGVSGMKPMTFASIVVAWAVAWGLKWGANRELGQLRADKD